MDRETAIENLGSLAARCELQAAKPALTPAERRYLLDMAGRYREAQYIEARKLNSEREAYAFANVLLEPQPVEALERFRSMPIKVKVTALITWSFLVCGFVAGMAWAVTK